MDEIDSSCFGKLRLRLAADVTFQSLGAGEDTVVLSLNSGYLHTCNETTAAFLRALDGSRTMEDVIDMMLREFEVDRAQLTRDLSDLSSELLQERLLVRRP